MKLIFLGTPDFAVPSLKRLVESRHEIAAVITQPDRPRGRGMRLAPSPIKTAALDLGLAVMQPENTSSASVVEEIRGIAPDAAAVVAYGQIVKRDFLDLSPKGCINLHPSLLPLYRGPTPIQSAIMAGDRMTGATTMMLDEGLDTGDILLQKEVEILQDDTAGTLHDKLAQIGADLMIETLDALETDAVTPRPQDNSRATFTKKLVKEDSTIDWSLSPERICDFSRALDPWPGCQTAFRGENIKVWKIRACEVSAQDAVPGEVVTADAQGLVVKGGCGTVRILELQLPGKKRMSVEDFMRGYAIKAGIILGV